MSTVLQSPRALAFVEALAALDASVEVPVGTLDHAFIELALYPHPWKELDAAIKQHLVVATEQRVDEGKLVKGRMGLALVWLAMQKVELVGWEGDDLLQWCERLTVAINAKISKASPNKEQEGELHVPVQDLDFVRQGTKEKGYGTDIGGSNAGTVGRHFCLNALLNILPTEPGAPLIAFSNPTNFPLWREKFDKVGGSKSLFVSDGVATNKWFYRGEYSEHSRGTVTSSDILKLSADGQKWWRGLLDGECDYAAEHKNWTTFAKWGFRGAKKTADSAMAELKTKEVNIAYAVYTCVGFDEESLPEWIATREKRLVIMAEKAARVALA
ncbi:hypothetical protein RQP46_007662 [Phenoliferia psychrophenolica]